jgi:hypothetical protein
MRKIYKFKSLLMVPDQADHSGKISYDMESVRDHEMEFRMADFFLRPSWISNLFIAIMALALVFALVYGVLVIGMKADMSFTGGGRLFILFFMLSCIILWLAMGVPAAIRSLKLQFVIKERGKGNWKILDEEQWDRFCRMRKMEQDRQEKEEQEKEEQKLRDQLNRM